MRSSRVGFWIGLLLGAHAASAQSPPASDAATVEWPVYGGNLASQFYSPLDQINARNVKDLKVAWRWSAANFGPNPELKSENTPLMIGGVLYATAGATRNVVAIDAKSGETLWIWRPNEGKRFNEGPRKM
jgi:glucose dehydrogenase